MTSSSHSSLLLYISTKKESFDLRKLALALDAHVQLFPYICSLNNKSNILEYGLLIKAIDVVPEHFKRQIWYPLRRIHPEIQCGFVHTLDYKGCVLNWPGVFRQSACISPCSTYIKSQL